MKVLLIDDDDNFRTTTIELLSMLGHQVTGADSVSTAKHVLELESFDRVLLDLMLPDGNGLEVLASIQAQENKSTKVTIITGHPAIKELVKSVYGPNVNYIIKPITLEKLQKLFLSETDTETPTGIEVESDGKRFCGLLVGQSAPMQKLYKMIERVAKTDANVMLLGESGVGKEVVAEAIHQCSNTNDGFVTVNCGAFTRDLINSELFGHEKGAFTGAIGKHLGVFEQAQDGNLFLDEVTEMPIDLQPNLLRTLETKTIVRLGGATPIDVNCRVISATNRTEQELAKEQYLRQDLYFRLAVFPIHIPALRERIEDIPLLVEHFLSQLNKEHNTQVTLNEDDQIRLMQYSWPGNVRELRHTIHRAFIMSDGDSLSLPETLGSPFENEDKVQHPATVGQTIESMERKLISDTLEQLQGDKKKAAKMLGISLKTLYNRLNEYDEGDMA